MHKVFRALALIEKFQIKTCHLVGPLSDTGPTSPNTALITQGACQVGTRVPVVKLLIRLDRV